jgi:2,3-bisphosphoglycerate-dependent phosphoglycerate mutase
MQLYFIRHGQSVNNALWSTIGCSTNRVEDPELTKTGVRQAELVSELLADSELAPSDSADSPSGSEFAPAGSAESPSGSAESEPDGANPGGFSLTHLYTSLMVRAVQTGTIISRRVGVPLTAWQDLHECGGIYLEGSKIPLPGKSREYFETNFPELNLPDSLDHRGWWNLPFEEDVDRKQRTHRVVERLRQVHGDTDHRVGFIAHGEFYIRLLYYLLQIPDGNRTWFTLNNAGITRVDMDPIYLNVVYLNRIEFLPKHLIT